MSVVIRVIISLIIPDLNTYILKPLLVFQRVFQKYHQGAALHLENSSCGQSATLDNFEKENEEVRGRGVLCMKRKTNRVPITLVKNTFPTWGTNVDIFQFIGDLIQII